MSDHPRKDRIVAPSSFEGWIGASREEITPAHGIYARNWGAAIHDVAESIHRPLTLTVLTLQSEKDGEPLVLITLDLGWWRTREDEWRLRGPLLDAHSLDPSRVMIQLSHTHSGPSLCREDADKPGGDRIGPFMDRLGQTVVSSTRKALEDAREGILTWSYGSCNLARHRDLPDPDAPRIVCGYNPDGTVGETLWVGRVTGLKDGGPIATIVHYPCHPVTLAWQNRALSPDYVGAMRELVENHTDNAPCLFLLGAAGEFGPQEQYTDDLSIADRNGRVLGYAALSILEGMLPPATGLRYAGVVESGAPLGAWERVPIVPSHELQARQIDVKHVLKEMPTVVEIEEQLRVSTDRALSERLARLRRVRRIVGEGKTASVPLWIWRIGDAFLLGQMNESYALWQSELRRRFPNTAVMALNLVNGACGYLPPSPLYDQDLYQVWQTPFERGGLEGLIEASTEAVQSLL